MTRHIPIEFSIPQFPLKSINCYITDNEQQTILIDAGINHPAFKDFFKKTITSENMSISSLDAVYLTHHHEDHVGLLPYVLSKKELPVYVHKEALPRLRYEEDFLLMRMHFFEQLYRNLDCLEDAEQRFKKLQKTYEKRHELKIDADFRIIEPNKHLGRFQVIHLPGHSEDSIGFYDAIAQEIFAGDALLAQTSTNPIVDPNVNGEYVHNSSQQRNTWTKLANMPIRTLYAGHQQPIKQVAAVVFQKQQKWLAKEQKVLSLLNHPMTGREIAQTFYGSLYKKQFSLIMSEMVGLLDLLEKKEQIIKIVEKGRYIFMKR
ncbi:MBL fold metallo-hydrolase [Kurthia senegalensis]|uniref:MBL fold metallo-hydrolase n=1 Tax=Kurthia senegalensis TaxID=1033740 RepID=UPI00028A004D|nr:MBL fold metallo-hydrolase [Kurthia senegalensis]